MTDMPHILIVDDDPRVRKLLRRYLGDEGFRVAEAADGEAMRAQMAVAEFDLILLDLIIPGEDGLSLAREVRQISAVPIIMVTGKGKMVDRVIGLEMGADDYITKPFHLREVLARIRTVLRRSATTSDGEQTKEPTPDQGEGVTFEGWRLDLVRRELRSPEETLVPLTTGEFDLLGALVKNANRVLSRDQLMDLVRNRDWTPYDRTIDTQVGRLRKKIERDPANPELIKTVRGVGYVFAAKVAPF